MRLECLHYQGLSHLLRLLDIDVDDLVSLFFLHLSCEYLLVIFILLAFFLLSFFLLIVLEDCLDVQENLVGFADAERLEGVETQKPQTF